jgi:hypothetical protein
MDYHYSQETEQYIALKLTLAGYLLVLRHQSDHSLVVRHSANIQQGPSIH